MASKQRSRAPKKQRAPNPLADLGIFEVPDIDLMDSESDVDDNALESELEAILSGKAPSKPQRPKKKVAPQLDFEQLAAEALKDPDEAEDDDDDESLLMDPALLKELEGLSLDDNLSHANEFPDLPNEGAHVPVVCEAEKPKPVGDIIILLSDRLSAYNEVLTAAKEQSDNSKVRRYGRAIKTLESLLKNAKAGRNVSEEDIPPAVKIPKQEEKQHSVSTDSNLPSDTVHDPLPSTDSLTKLIDTSAEMQKLTSEDETGDCKNLIHRRDQYKVAALQAKKAGDKATALMYMKYCKTFDSVIEALKKGEPVDLSHMPPPPPTLQETIAPPAEHSGPPKDFQKTQTSSAIESAALSAASEPEDPSMFSAPPAPSSVLEALEQRLQKYCSTKDAALAEGNNSKVRRLQRIVKVYENAIKDYKAGKRINFEELPTPPGFAPIPVPPVHLSTNAATLPNAEKREEKPCAPEVKPPVPPPKRPAPQVPAKTRKPKVQRTNTFDKQLDYLIERQKLFRQAALAAKKNGDLQQAKEYLRMSKGFDSMIEATKCGLPIDASSIPTPPQLETDFVVVDVSECVENEERSTELMEILEKDLAKQIEVCTRNKEHFLHLGDVSSASKFEKLGLDSRKDLSVIHHLIKTEGSAPKFHYETRLFSMVQCHTDLSDTELEVTLERGINLPGKPDDLDAYVKIEFPIPSDAPPQRAKTHTIRDTNNPIFQEEFKFEFNRKSRAQLRQFKRQALKLEVYAKGCHCFCFSGFLRSDSLLGTVNVKLLDLESKCTIHECFDLMDGRKAVGGKLEVKLRIRDPLLVKQVEEVREKWLVIGS